MRQRSRKQVMCHVLIILLVFTYVIQPVTVYGAEGEEMSSSTITDIQKAKEAAIEWLYGQLGEDGRVGISPLVNDTCMALEQFREEGMEVDSVWLHTQLDVKENQNTDTLSRMYCALRQEEIRSRLRTIQNPDGGYGLTADYESEVLDSMLVLEAFACAAAEGTESTGRTESICNSLISYMQSIQQDNGGFSYMEGMEADSVLTLRIGIAADRIQDRQTGSNLQLDRMLKNIDQWLLDNTLQQPDLGECFEEGAYQCLYLLCREQGTKLDGLEEELLALQQEDGSFNQSITDTVLGIRLLRAWEAYYTPYIRINHMETSLSNYTLIMNRSTEVAVTTTCEYAVNYDTEVIWQILLCEGDTETELWRQTGTLNTEKKEVLIEQTVSITAEPEQVYELKVVLMAGQTVLAETRSKLYTKEIIDTELKLNGDAVTGEDYTVKLSWNDVSDDNCHYGYRIYRRTGDGEWETRSSWDSEEVVRVLNIYPCMQAKDYLTDWMNMPLTGEDTPAGQNLFDIDTVYIDDYNVEPEKYLKDEAGSYQYDVLFFGTYDSNAFKDLTEESYVATQAFVDSGRGVLFGHDTVCMRGRQAHPQFAKFAEQLGIKLGTISTDSASSNVRVVNSGFLTSYPWKIEGDIKVPPTHALGQYTGGTLKATVWMELDRINSTDAETGGISNAYLFTRNQLAMIQTGHSNGKATDDERKVIANTLFYLKQLTNATEAVDRSAYDTEAPEVTGIGKVVSDGGRQTVVIQGCDYGTQYEYYVEAMAEGDEEGLYRKESNTVAVNMTSGIQGYLIGISDSSSVMDSLISRDEEGNLMNVYPADGEGNYTYVLDSDADTGRYIHVRPVDYAGNIGEEMVVKLEAETVIPEVPADNGEYFNTGYALFSTEDTVIYGSNVGLYGTSYVGTGMMFGGNSICSTGAIRSTGAITTYAGNTTIAERMEYSEAVLLPDYRASILNDMAENGSMEEIAVYNSTSIQTPVHCQSTTGAYCPDLSLEAGLLSENSINISTDQITVGGEQPVAICSAHGDIYINAMTLSGNGLIYAPEGTVTIQVSQMDFKGSIIAKRICIQGDTLHAGTERE